MKSLLEQGEGGDGSDPVFRNRIRLSFRHAAVATLSLPFLSFLFCIIWSLLFSFRQTTATHCGVVNYLPSISSAIGHYPQSHVWKLGIALHTAPRLFVASIYLEHYKTILVSSSIWLTWMTVVFNVAEILSLLGLSLISSTFIHELHAACFTLFVICATLYMLLTLVLLQIYRRSNESALERKSRQLKITTFLVNCLGVAFAVYLYVRHNKYCEPYVYTWFALAEYAVVLSNMAFHATAYQDFYYTKVIITARGVKII